MQYIASFIVFTILFGIARIGVNAAPPSPIPVDGEKKNEASWTELQGTWKCDTMIYPGIPKVYPGNTIDFNREPYLYLVIKDKKAYMIDMYNNGKSIISKKAIRINATKEPKQWDFSGNAGDGKKIDKDGKPKDPDHPTEDEWQLGIYKIVKDVLVVAESGVRPTEFKPIYIPPTQPGLTGEEVSVWTYKKSNDRMPEIK